MPALNLGVDRLESGFLKPIGLGIAAATLVGIASVGGAVIREDTTGIAATVRGGLMMLYVVSPALLVCTMLACGCRTLWKARKLAAPTADAPSMPRALRSMLRSDDDCSRPQRLEKRGVILLALFLLAVIAVLDWMLGFPVGQPRGYLQ